MKKIITITCLLLFYQSAFSQRMLDDIVDSLALANRAIKFLNEKYGNLSFSGYMQPQFQVASADGTDAAYQGGAFGDYNRSRFRLRRGRLRADYSSFHENGMPATFFVFQFDGTEQGVNIRDFWGRYYENKWQLFSFSAGMMGRPFSYELLLSSNSREAPERGRMSQILMKTERDLGIMVTVNPHSRTAKYKNLQLDVGIYNGQGLAGPAEYDDAKDLVSRFTIKSTPIPKTNLMISGGLGLVYGAITNPTLKTAAFQQGRMVIDSAIGNLGKNLPRRYYGADIQLGRKHPDFETTLRAEYMFGRQTASFNSSATPGSYPLTGNTVQPLYTRNFNGGYFYFIQNIKKGNELIFKYDFYDPNTDVKGENITANNGFSEADIRYQTFGIGYLRFINEHMKLVLWYDRIYNEKTALSGFEKDVKDNVFTARLQFMF